MGTGSLARIVEIGRGMRAPVPSMGDGAPGTLETARKQTFPERAICDDCYVKFPTGVDDAIDLWRRSSRL